MKNRSHRLPVSEPRHDDWVDESWTVDCICGVNFDDGEEMVNCDECGVWVHTRCSRYVKSEKSFACDKCKNTNNKNLCAATTAAGTSSMRNDNEETEVAEFLLELPTKTLGGMENPTPSALSTRRPFRLWTDIPMEERVHVQGVPGGDPSLFSGLKMSSVFGPELWKCTGYVPKKFSFRYTEFPCGDDDGMASVEKKNVEIDKRNGEDSVNQADNGAVVLVSLSKEFGSTLPTTPVVDSFGVKIPIGGGATQEAVSPSYTKKLAAKRADSACPEDSMKKESSSAQPIVSYLSKRKKEEMRLLKDQSSKKKVRTIEHERVVKKRAAHAIKADARSIELSQDRSSKVVTADNDRVKDVIADQPSDALVECATNLSSKEHSSEATLIKNVSSEEMSRERNKGDQVPVRFENFSKTHNGILSLTKPNNSRSTPAKNEVYGDDISSFKDIGGVSGRVGIGSHDKEPVAVDGTVTALDVKDNDSGQDTNIGDTNSRPNKKLKVKVGVDDHISRHNQCLPLDDVRLDTNKGTSEHPELSPNSLSENGHSIETSVIKSESSDHKVHDGSSNKTIANSRTDIYHESSAQLNRSNQEPTVSEGSLGARKRPSRIGQGSEVAEELPKSIRLVTSHSAVPYQRKVVVSVRKSAATSTSNIPKFGETRTVANDQKPTIDSRLKGISESSVETMKDRGISLTNTVKADEKCVRTKKLLKESSRLNSVLKSSQSTKSSSTSDSNRMSSDPKDPKIHSTRVPLVPDVTNTPGFGESDSQRQLEGTSVPNKATGSTLPSKSEKFCQPSNRPSSRGNVASMTTPTSSNIPATLSDQELALLLHQELNSSPRVPRVPRMRHAGSLPQLTCPSTSSMLMKQTSSNGGKDHGVASKKKSKDLSGDGSHCPVEVGSEPKKMDRKLSSPDKRRRVSVIDSDSRREGHGGPIKGLQSMKMTNMSSSLSSSSDANANNLSSSCPSSRNASDDDPRMVSRLTNRTLPGLIADIMSEGKRMTYEELCNAVLPHWPHMRKHNGERYAYSSHSQAVLDCLRNRSEWARLVDRGPKSASHFYRTSTSRKRCKFDADSVSMESEDNEVEKHAKDIDVESQHEVFPKGKRKARKRRRLALQGRGIVRRRRRAEVVSDDENESRSSSSEEIMSSEEEIQRNEASASSDEVL